MQGASPLASPGLNPRGTGSPCRCGKLNGGLAPALPARRVSAVPGGGRACFAACLPCHCGARGGGGVPALSPAYTAFRFLFCPPSPQPPSRREGGDYRLFYARGFAPCIPGAEPGRHWLSPPRGRGPSQTPKFLSPGPPSPWLPALPPVNKQKPLVVQVPRPSQLRGCKGRSPLHKKTLILPLPRRGRGGGGIGGSKAS